MRISFLEKESHIDYPGNIASVIFSPDCNYHCPACHARKVMENKDYILQKEFFEYLDHRKEWIDAFVLCGGEPTLEKDLTSFLNRIKNIDYFLVKLDTNGSNPNVIQSLIENKLIDYIAMDVKGSENLYDKVVGGYANISRVKESMKIISKFPHEFRTTIVPVIGEEIKWMSPGDVADTAKFILNTTGKKNDNYFLQKFVARPKEEMLDERLSTDNLPKGMHTTPVGIMMAAEEEAQKYLPYTQIRL